MAHHMPTMRTIDAAGWEGLLALGQTRSFPAGANVFEDKATASTLFVVTRGEIEILKEAAPGQLIRLALLQPDSLFGAGALFDRQARSAHSRALGGVDVLEIPASHANAYLEANPTFAQRFFRHMCDVQHRIIANLDSELGELHRRLAPARG